MTWIEIVREWMFDPTTADQQKVGKIKFLKAVKAGEPTHLTAVGISNGKVKKFASAFYKENKNINFTDLIKGIDEIWRTFGISEAHVFCCALLGRYKKGFTDELWQIIDGWIDEIDQWISADHLAIDVMKHFPMDEAIFLNQLAEWKTSPNFWRRRLSIVAILKHFKKDPKLTDFLLEQIEQLKFDKNYYVRKSLPWLLREASKTNPEPIADYLLLNYMYFGKTELREASRNLDLNVQEELIYLHDELK